MDQYAKSFTKPSIRIGTITVLLAMLGSFFPNIYLYLAHGVWPDASHMFSAWGSVAMAFGAFYLVEPISYFPVFGPTGTYIGILSGNISQIRLPAASTAQDVLGVEPSSHKGEVVGILAICGSVVKYPVPHRCRCRRLHPARLPAGVRHLRHGKLHSALSVWCLLRLHGC